MSTTWPHREDDHVDWLRGLHGGPLRVQDRERRLQRATPKRRREWPVWLLLAACTAGLLTAVAVFA